MRIKWAIISTCLIMALPLQVLAMEEHGSQIFHAITLETDTGASHDGALSTWDLDGWIGNNTHKLWLKSEGEIIDGNTTESAEIWALYSRNVSTFWDAQVGIRYDEEPHPTGYLTLGVNGLAPYLFETEAHLFVSDDGDVTARIRQDNDLLITQKLIVQPYVEINLAARDVPELELGAGITNTELGIQTRYEITRKFAPYIDLRYERKFGETSAIAHHNGNDSDNAVASMGLRVMF